MKTLEKMAEEFIPHPAVGLGSDASLEFARLYLGELGQYRGQKVAQLYALLVQAREEGARDMRERIIAEFEAWLEDEDYVNDKGFKARLVELPLTEEGK